MHLRDTVNRMHKGIFDRANLSMIFSAQQEETKLFKKAKNTISGSLHWFLKYLILQSRRFEYLRRNLNCLKYFFLTSGNSRSKACPYKMFCCSECLCYKIHINWCDCYLSSWMRAKGRVWHWRTGLTENKAPVLDSPLIILTVIWRRNRLEGLCFFDHWPID